MKIKYTLTTITAFIVLVAIIYYTVPLKTVEYYEIAHGVTVNSSSPNVMDAFTVSAYLRNDENRPVQVKPFKYPFKIIDARRVNNIVSDILYQEDILKLIPDETIIIHKETIYPQTPKTYLISSLGETTSLTVEGWSTGLSYDYSTTKNHVSVCLEKYTWTKDETPVITVHNMGNSMITIGVGYWLQRYVNETWERYSPTTPQGDAFIMVGISFEPGGEYSHNVTISHLEPGYYRIIKSVSFGTGKDHMLDYLVEFQIA